VLDEYVMECAETAISASIRKPSYINILEKVLRERRGV
jgi:hypothetical protein